MNTKQKKTKTVTETLSFKPLITAEAAKAEFLKTVPKKEDTEIDDALSKFVYVMDYLLANTRSFSESDVLIAARQFDIPATEIQRYFQLWVRKMESLGKLSCIRGAYDSEIYIPQG